MDKTLHARKSEINALNKYTVRAVINFTRFDQIEREPIITWSVQCVQIVATTRTNLADSYSSRKVSVANTQIRRQVPNRRNLDTLKLIVNEDNHLASFAPSKKGIEIREVNEIHRAAYRI